MTIKCFCNLYHELCLTPSNNNLLVHNTCEMNVMINFCFFESEGDGKGNLFKKLYYKDDTFKTYYNDMGVTTYI